MESLVAASSLNETWPYECENGYEKLSIIRKVRFGNVWLANSKRKNQNSAENIEYYEIPFVAIKILDTSTGIANSYAQREIEILRELDHPNCITFFNSYQCDVNHCSVIVTNFVEGPTLYSLLQMGGALGLSLSKLITKELLEVVSYLHSRGVIHCDLKPNNCIITGANPSDDAVWSNDDEDVNKWKLVLFDFSFARALSASEIKNKEMPNDVKSMKLPLDPDTCYGMKKRMKNKRSSINNASLYCKLEISALSCCLPESKLFHSLYRRKKTSSVPDYNTKCDAFSLGCILRYVYTGVPPNEDIGQYISFRKNSLLLLTKMLCVCNKESSGQGQLQFRYMSEIPGEVSVLIDNLTNQDEEKRITVRKAYNKFIFKRRNAICLSDSDF